jgi:pyruvate dehydrogenase complex dehydrogenase (E1) component
MNKDHLIAALEEINAANAIGDNMSALWDKLPDYVAGPNWIGEIIDAASQWQGYLYEDKDYSLDDLTDYVHELANGECETYYSHINKRVQDLALWAYPAIDSDVEDLTGGQIVDLTLTGLNSLYLFAAMRSLFAAVIEYAYERAAELESELANA